MVTLTNNQVRLLTDLTNKFGELNANEGKPKGAAYVKALNEFNKLVKAEAEYKELKQARYLYLMEVTAKFMEYVSEQTDGLMTLEVTDNFENMRAFYLNLKITDPKVSNSWYSFDINMDKEGNISYGHDHNKYHFSVDGVIRLLDVRIEDRMVEIIKFMNKFKQSR